MNYAYNIVKVIKSITINRKSIIIVEISKYLLSLYYYLYTIIKLNSRVIFELVY